MREEILSVGIDIGTSTTQVIVSRLTLENQANAFSMPRIALTEKEILYKSAIHFTPLLSETRIDAQGVRDIVALEYAKANIKQGDIQTGAVIITGETARKDNAREVLHALSAFAGDFVVATVGANLESSLAAKGAGIDQLSKENRLRILHCDIGGGTANLALYDAGKLLETGCLDIGGRLIKIEPETQRILSITPKLHARFPQLALGQKVTPEIFAPVLEEMVETLLTAGGCADRQEALSYYTTAQTKPLAVHEVQWSISGGVADCLCVHLPPDPFRYGDIGILLGHTLQKAFVQRGIVPLPVQETIRATVAGAGTHSLSLSGSTIYHRAMQFPLKNIPVLRLEAGEALPETLAETLSKKIHWHADEDGLGQIALAFRGKHAPSYQEVQALARALVQGLDALLRAGHVPIIVLEEDLAKVLGQTLAQQMQGSLLCMDGVSVQNGDYIDIGQPLAGGQVLPVVVKTLAFEH